MISLTCQKLRYRMLEKNDLKLGLKKLEFQLDDHSLNRFKDNHVYISEWMQETDIQNLVYKDAGDLIALPCFVLNNNGRYEVSYFTKEDLESYGMTADDLFKQTEDAIRLMHPVIDSLGSILYKMSNGREGSEEDNINLLYISTKYADLGAGTIMLEEIKRDLFEILGQKIYILPSSIHEVLAVPADHSSLLNYQAIVANINQNVCEAGVIISDQVYQLTDNGLFTAE